MKRDRNTNPAKTRVRNLLFASAALALSSCGNEKEESLITLPPQPDQGANTLMDLRGADLPADLSQRDSSMDSRRADLNLAVLGIADSKAADSRSPDSKAKADSKIADARPYDSKIPDSKHPDSKIADARADSKPMDSKPADSKPKPDSLIADALVSHDSAKPDMKAKCAAATIGKFTGLMVKGTPLTVGGYVIDYKGLDLNKNTVFDISCGGASTATNLACISGKPTVLTVPSDGMKITINVFVAVGPTVNLFVAVEKL